jgi:hypothetical protein
MPFGGLESWDGLPVAFCARGGAFRCGTVKHAVAAVAGSVSVAQVVKTGTPFAYGQTSAGKTHALMGSRAEPGLLILAMALYACFCFEPVEARLDADAMVYGRAKPPPGRSVGAVLTDRDGVEWLVKCTPSNVHTTEIIFATSVLNDPKNQARVRAVPAQEITIHDDDGGVVSLLATRMVHDLVTYDSLSHKRKRVQTDLAESMALFTVLAIGDITPPNVGRMPNARKHAHALKCAQIHGAARARANSLTQTHIHVRVHVHVHTT